MKPSKVKNPTARVGQMFAKGAMDETGPTMITSLVDSRTSFVTRVVKRDIFREPHSTKANLSKKARVRPRQGQLKQWLRKTVLVQRQ